jgi:hypothetical protein
MMPRSKKLLGSGDQEYFNEKRPVNVRVDRTFLIFFRLPSPVGVGVEEFEVGRQAG